ncbi:MULTISPECIES: sensor histidine kinase [unclassified Solwaraspora]|uniref:sensor histidine kinase n=1 Tax=unclassified Solwaraspora TaxID=2627926 RepID=UPI00248AE542|nr:MULTISPECIES: sensor histidine kinase [unclassified Solwaraspora]WBB97866.1 sensor histidine kinase [Solwaraspora sp. WMMA2059]WBC23574.1 sensor histidine kinase [Solwaraspora sp. WMMA2080]WJK34339.1 sensor histidine kinase [Solwaraspora sp. WMMA2065]
MPRSQPDTDAGPAAPHWRSAAADAGPAGSRRGPGLAVLTAIGQPVGTAVAASWQSGNVSIIGYALLVFSGLALADRHRSPRRNFLIVVAATLAYHLLDQPAGVTLLAPMIAASAARAAGHRWLVGVAAVTSYGIWVLVTGATLRQATLALVLIVAAGLVTEIGTLVADRVREGVAEQRRLSEERQRRRATEQRLLIAAELHDVLGHHLSLINVRAGVGLHLMDRDPEQARAALEAIAQSSAEALREVRAVLDTLYPRGEAAPRAPAPGLDRLGELTDDAAVPTRTVIDGPARPLPAAVDRAAYRIVQEALTNVRRHAGPGAAATVTIGYRQDAVMLQIDDDGAGAPGPAASVAPAPAGNGITGMRERAAALGGELTAGPAPDGAGGWRVRAHLPLPTDSQAEETST